MSGLGDRIEAFLQRLRVDDDGLSAALGVPLAVVDADALAASDVLALVERARTEGHAAIAVDVSVVPAVMLAVRRIDGSFAVGVCRRSVTRTERHRRTWAAGLTRAVPHLSVEADAAPAAN